MTIRFWLLVHLLLLWLQDTLYVDAMSFEYCWMFGGTCRPSCAGDPNTFPLKGFTWCNGGNKCCFKFLLRPSTAAPTPISTTAPSTAGSTAATQIISTLGSSTRTSTTQRTSKATPTTSQRPSTRKTIPTTTTNKETTITPPISLSSSTKTPTTLMKTSRITSTESTPKSTDTTAFPVQECGVAGRGVGPIGRIIGGRKAERCEMPWMVRIVLPLGPCGGALIDSRHVITAAHCFDGYSRVMPELIIGEYNTSELAPTEKFSTKNYTVMKHPSYRPLSYIYDIAIARLHTEVDYNKYRCVQPLCLPAENQVFPVDTDCIVAGWGVTEPEYDVFNAPTSPVLQKVTLSVLHERLCTRMFGKYYSEELQLCAGHLPGDRDSCDGDSGGPLMCRSGIGNEYYAAGIVSSGAAKCAQPQSPAIYTDVSAFLPWIFNVTGG